MRTDSFEHTQRISRLLKIEITRPMRWSSALFCIFILVTLAGCAISPSYVPEPQPLEPGRLPSPNAALNVPHLRPCTDAPDRTLHLNTNYPVTVLVHGCTGSAGRFRSLAQLYAFHGQQAVCFSYESYDRKWCTEMS